MTTDLQKAIAEKFGLRCVETLTGFKYIGQKLGFYEAAIPEALRRNYTDLPEEETRRLRLEHSSFYVFGGEESYGYSASDFVRDKDGNTAAVLIAEAAAYAKSRGTTLAGLLDEIFAEFGVYLERGESLTMDGAEGAAQINKLVASYASNPPKEMDGSPVDVIRNFATDTIHDIEGDLIPSEAMIMVSLADGRRVAIRPSGTEPKSNITCSECSGPPVTRPPAPPKWPRLKAWSPPLWNPFGNGWERMRGPGCSAMTLLNSSKDGLRFAPLELLSAA